MLVKLIIRIPIDRGQLVLSSQIYRDWNPYMMMVACIVEIIYSPPHFHRPDRPAVQIKNKRIGR